LEKVWVFFIRLGFMVRLTGERYKDSYIESTE